MPFSRCRETTVLVNWYSSSCPLYCFILSDRIILLIDQESVAEAQESDDEIQQVLTVQQGQGKSVHVQNVIVLLYIFVSATNQQLSCLPPYSDMSGNDSDTTMDEQQLLQENEQLKEALSRAKCTPKKKASDNDEDPMCDAIKRVVYRKLWRNTKFVTSDNQLSIFVKKVWDNLGFKPELVAHINPISWEMEHKDVVLSCLNKARTYAISKI